jgi:serine/threonine-protein kinase
LPPVQAAEITDQVARALDAAHKRGLVHRDIKPSNVLLSDDHAYLTDFGITRLVDERTTSTDAGKWVGTFDYMSPEQLRGEAVDARSDVYSLGCLLYACLAGSAPFHRDTAAATITAHLHEEPPRISDVPGVPKAFDAVISRALAKEPKDRYRSAGELGSSALAAAHGRGQRGWRFARRSEPEVASPIVTSVPVMAPAPEATRVADPARPTVVRGDAETKLARTAMMPAPAEETSRLPGAAHGRRPWQLRPRGVDLALLGGLLAVVVAIAVIILVTDHGPRRASGPLTGGQINAAVHDFATDYSRHDVRSLSRLLASDVSRVDPSSSQHGRAAVLREYESQFTTRPVPTSYVLGDLRVTPGWAGRAEGEYTLTVAGGGHLSGHVVFGLQRTGNRAQLALISTQ